MTDTPFGPTTRVVTQDGAASGPAPASGMPGGSNMQFASAETIRIAEQQRAAEEAGTPQEKPTTRVGDGARRVTINSDGSTSVEDLGLRRSNSAPALRNDVLDNAISQEGQVLNRSALTPDTLITVNGIQMTLAGAEGAGIVVRAPDGSYRDASFKDGPADKTATPEPSTEAENTTDNTEDTPETDDRNVVEILLENNGSLKGEIYTAAIDIIGDPDRDPGDLLEAIDEFADKPKLGAQFTALQDIKATEAREVVTRAGVQDPNAFVAWARQQGGWSKAMSTHLLEGNANDAWSTMARTYVRDVQTSVDFSDADILGADFGGGVTVARGPDGTPWITVEDFTGPFSEAVARGLVTVSSA